MLRAYFASEMFKLLPSVFLLLGCFASILASIASIKYLHHKPEQHLHQKVPEHEHDEHMVYLIKDSEVWRYKGCHKVTEKTKGYRVNSSGFKWHPTDQIRATHNSSERLTKKACEFIHCPACSCFEEAID
jgi:hypothetical protein